MCLHRRRVVASLILVALTTVTPSLADSQASGADVEFGSNPCPKLTGLSPSERREILRSDLCAIVDGSEPIPGSEPLMPLKIDTPEPRQQPITAETLETFSARLLSWLIH